MDVASSDRGVYSCSASNDAATVAADTELLVENVPPRAPRNLLAAPAATAVHVSWQSGAYPPSPLPSLPSPASRTHRPPPPP